MPGKDFSVRFYDKRFTVGHERVGKDGIGPYCGIYARFGVFGNSFQFRRNFVGTKFAESYGIGKISGSQEIVS